MFRIFTMNVVGLGFVSAAIFLVTQDSKARLNASAPRTAIENTDSKTSVTPHVPHSLPSNSAYLTNLTTARQELVRFAKNERWRPHLSAQVATLESYVGRYRRAFEAIEPGISYGKGDALKPNAYDSSQLNGFEACDAVDTILEFASERQVVMINEAHHVPMHRAFTIQLLERLYKKGFRYFAAETLNHKDDALQSRGYPVLKTGHYTCEPVYADLVRTALRLGYQVVPYEFVPEVMPGQEGDPHAIFTDRKRLIAMQNTREEGQAKNLRERILLHDPKAKIVVHAGYGHIAKTSNKLDESAADDEPEMAMMGFFLRKLTGIDPLSIDQTQRSERGTHQEESPEYRYVVESKLVKGKPVIFRDRTTKRVFMPAKNEKTGLDLIVYHPRSEYENGRPTWLAMGGRRRAHLVKTDLRPEKGSSYLAQAFYTNEVGADTIPADQMEYDSDEPIPTLWLPHGSFRVRIIDSTGKTLHEYSASH